MSEKAKWGEDFKTQWFDATTGITCVHCGTDAVVDAQNEYSECECRRWRLITYLTVEELPDDSV